MAILEELTEAVNGIAAGIWDNTDGQVVPETTTVGLGNKGVRLDATFLYADLADSTELASHSETIAAEIYKAFLLCCTKLILQRGGHIRSFDGDRVMGVFVGSLKNTNAVKTALHIKYVFDNIIVPRFQFYEVFSSRRLTLNYCTGIDSGSALVARAGVRNNNDLIWVGQAPNVAAKLSTLRESPFTTVITQSVYNAMADEAKFTNGQSMWESRQWTALPAGRQSVYRSTWQWKP